MDTSQALKDAENALRDFLAAVLPRSLGEDWLVKCGVTQDRINKWKERKLVEAKRQEAGVVEERLLYYADFYDLRTILKINWSGEVAAALGEWRTFEVFLSELEKLRDPDAHRRDLMPHQKHLAIGISGEIRNRIVRYRSQKDTAEDCFPRIESARDSLGHIWTPPPTPYNGMHILPTHSTLHPGDVVDFLVTASDPEGLELEYAMTAPNRTPPSPWQRDGAFQLRLLETHISKQFSVGLYVRSLRPWHAYRTHDDAVGFGYQVLPRFGTT